MPSPRKGLVTGWVLFIACSGLPLPWALAESLQSSQTPPASSSSPRRAAETFRLDSRQKVLRRLDSHAVHRYCFDLRPGQALDAVVDQKGVDVEIKLVAPDGLKLFLVDSPNHDTGQEEIFLVAKSAGTYCAELRNTGSEDAPGASYQIRVRSLRTASPADRLHAQAEELFYKAREHRDDRPDEAMAQFFEAERLWKSLGNSRRRANALERVGTILSKHKKNLKKALEFQNRSYELYRSIGDLNSEARMLVTMGVSRRQLSDLSGAEDCYRRALSIASTHDLREQKAHALLNLGLLLRLEGDKWRALESFESALPIWENIGDSGMEVQTLNSLGIIYTSFGQYQMAMSYFEKALERLDSAPSDSLSAQTLERISELNEKRGDWSRALIFARRALQLRQKARDRHGESGTLAEIGLILRNQGDLTLARDSMEKALEVVRSTSDKAGEASAYMNLGLIVIDQKNWRTALEYLNRALDLAREQGYREVEVKALYGIAQAERLRGNPINARIMLEQIPGQVEDLLKGDIGDDEHPETFLEIRQQSYDMLVDLLVRSPAGSTPKPDLARAFEANERSRWRNLLEALNPTQARNGSLRPANPALLAERTRLREALGRIDEDLIHQNRRGTSSRHLRTEQEKLAERLRTVEVLIRLSDPWAGVSSRPVPISLKETQALLDSDTVLLEYRLGRERSFLWLVTPDSAEVFALPARAIIEEDAKQLHTYLADAGFPTRQAQAIPVAERLSEALLSPVAARLKGRKLIIVRDGALHYVPFSALPDPEGKILGWQSPWPCPLIMRHDLVYLPSMSVLDAVRSEASRRKPQPGALAVLAAPNFEKGGLPELPKSREEALRILKLVPPGAKTLSAFGPDATRDLAMSGKLSHYRMLHFATHAENNLQYPELSSIVLSQLDKAGKKNGYLRFQDIRDLDLPADLVVLSACRTSLGKEVAGEGPVGLAQAFMYAGASRVVVSLWDVFEDSTPELMERFYRSVLKEGRSPSWALSAAQRWMAQQPDWQSPFYWASFELQGEWR